MNNLLLIIARKGWGSQLGISRLLAFKRVFGVVIMSLCFLGCGRGIALNEEKSSLPTEMQVSVIENKSNLEIGMLEAIRIAVKQAEEIAKIQDKDFDLSVRKRDDGWSFVFWILPKSPGGFFQITVSSQGDAVFSPGM